MVLATVVDEANLWTFRREHAWYGPGGGWLIGRSWVLVCPQCSRNWAHLRTAGEDLTWPIAAVCGKCSSVPGLGVPGSILVELAPNVIDEALLAALPEDLLRREFALHLAHYERPLYADTSKLPRHESLA